MAVESPKHKGVVKDEDTERLFSPTTIVSVLSHKVESTRLTKYTPENRESELTAEPFKS